jgi:hypothetical protein
MPTEDETEEIGIQEVAKHKPHRVRLPGFVSDEDIGLGDAISRISYAAGIQPCGGCARRAAALNRWMVFTR